MSEHPDITLPDFVLILQEEYKKIHISLSIPNVEEFRFCELNYSARIKAVTRVTRDVGVPLNKDDFNHVVVGRLTVRDAFAFMQKKVQETKAEEPKPHTHNIFDFTPPSAEALIPKGGFILEPPTNFKF